MKREREASAVYSCISDAGASWGKVLEQMTRSADRVGSRVLQGIFLRWVHAKPVSSSSLIECKSVQQTFDDSFVGICEAAKSNTKSKIKN